jgi:hypothetical protein
MTWTCEHDDELQGSIKGGEFLYRLSDSQIYTVTFNSDCMQFVVCNTVAWWWSCQCLSSCFAGLATGSGTWRVSAWMLVCPTNISVVLNVWCWHKRVECKNTRSSRLKLPVCEQSDYTEDIWKHHNFNNCVCIKLTMQSRYILVKETQCLIKATTWTRKVEWTREQSTGLRDFINFTSRSFYPR